MKRQITDELPLSESTYMILLSLIEPAHGYGIMRNIENLSGGRSAVGPGTLYGALKTMLKKKWIEEMPAEDTRRRLYRLTPMGRQILTDEIDRLRFLSDLGGQKFPAREENNERED
jgi:DNA-binding PadR family transcriptional regulator